MTSLTLEFILVLLGTVLISSVLTPLVKILAFYVGAVDQPNARRINKVPMPSAGGLAVVLTFVISTLFLMPLVFPAIGGQTAFLDYVFPIILGGIVVTMTGFCDDIYDIRPLPKIAGIVFAALIIYQFTDFKFDSFKLPFGGPFLYFPEWLTFIATIAWIVGITNAINFLDGLDGLLSGVAMINLISLGLVSYFFLYDSNLYLTLLIFILVAAILGFSRYNRYPAQIYLGDTGSLFIGFMISVMSLQGLKNATTVAVISPILILGVPIFDTGLAIVRRQLSGKKFYEPDRMHLHHRLMSAGFSHRGAVFMVHSISFLFSFASLLFNLSSRIGGIILIVCLIFACGMLVDNLEILGEHRRPFMGLLKFIGSSDFRQEQLAMWRHRRKYKHKHKK